MAKANLQKFGTPRPTVFISDEHIARSFNWPDAVRALSEAYALPSEPAMVPPRTMARGRDVWLRSLTAVSPSGRHMGCKLISAKLRGRPVLASYLLALIRQDNLQLAALMDANRITGIRTAATAVVGMNALVPRESAVRLGILGAGFEARNFLEALRASRAVGAVRVFSPTPSSRQGFAARFRQEAGLDIEAVDSAEEVVRWADVVLCAARSRDETPVLNGEWLRPGAVVLSLGSTLPEQRELDTLTMERARTIVADMVDEVIEETGDGIAASAAGIDLHAKVVYLGDVARKKPTPREADNDIVVYKSVGTALQDVVIAEMLFEGAVANGLYEEMKTSIEPVAK